ncbi:hypothetical protein FRX31_025885, partial [Thalictrum thalictroides]
LKILGDLDLRVFLLVLFNFDQRISSFYDEILGIMEKNEAPLKVSTSVLKGGERTTEGNQHNGSGRF